jgi:hypothetical protein
MARSTPSTRIGDAERAEAHRALQEHLDAGRLTLTEFVERFAVAAEAVTAADLAAVFADLPAPHPTLPAPPRERVRRSALVVGVVVALALVGSIGFAVGRVRPRASRSPLPLRPSSRARCCRTAWRYGGAPARG